ncbi:MAG: hypothetical protein NTZ33_04740 [Bacteroidetes bacterium]|nr:hypothetical protein [Bacteroidota bacterium]
MKKSIIFPNDSKIKLVEDAILTQLKNNNLSFLRLIRNSNFEFNSTLSYRMLNYYSDKNIIRASRATKNGKRKFSFSDRISLEFALYLKKIGKRFDIIVQFNNNIHQEDAKLRMLSPFDLVIMITSVFLSSQDFFLVLGESKVPGDGQSSKISLLSEGNEYNFNISEEIRKITQTEPDNSSKSNRLSEFLSEFTFHIDNIRKTVGMPLIDPENYNLHNSVSIKQAVARMMRMDRLSINNLPFQQLMFDILYMNEDKQLFGIEIKAIGDNYHIPKGQEGLLVKSESELLKMLLREISMIKVRSKRNE